MYFLFDLNGTMIDDMHYHIKAWHGILNQLGASISMEQMKEECYGKNEELLERTFPGRFTAGEKMDMSFEKERAYQAAFKPELKLINGLDNFLARAKAQEYPMAIGSAAILFNIDFVLDGLHIRPYFDAIVSADQVTFSKPHPETYLSCAALLQADPSSCIVFEDSPKGVASAKSAGMRAVVIGTLHKEEEFAEFDNLICYVQDFLDPALDQLFPTQHT